MPGNTPNELKRLRTLAEQRGLARIAAVIDQLIAQQENRHEH